MTQVPRSNPKRRRSLFHAGGGWIQREIKRWVRLRPRLSALILFGGLCLLLLTAWRPHGPPATPDSGAYWAASRSWLASGELWHLNGKPLTIFPPMYPVLLALQSVFPVRGFAGSVSGAGLISAALLFWALYRLLHVSRWTRPWAGIGAFAACLYHPVYSCLLHAWSEGLFLALIAVWLLCLHRMLASPRVFNLLLLGGVTAALVLTRYAGLFLLPLAGLFCCIPAASTPAVRIGRAGLCVVAGALPPGLWFFRNHLLTGDWTGGRFPTMRSPMENLSEGVQTLATWHVGVRAGAWLSWVVVLALVAVFAWLVRQGWRRDGKAGPPGWWIATPLLAAGYLAWIWMLSSRSAMDPLSTRLLAPAAVPLFLAAMHGLCAWPRPLARVSLAFVLMAPSLARDLRDTWRSHRDGMGTFSPSFRNSPLLTELRRIPDREIILSNTADVLLILGDRMVRPMPLRYGDSASKVERFTPAEAAAQIPPGAWILWHGPEDESRLHRLGYSPGELAADAGLELIRRWPEASVWRRSIPPAGAR